LVTLHVVQIVYGWVFWDTHEVAVEGFYSGPEAPYLVTIFLTLALIPTRYYVPMPMQVVSIPRPKVSFS